MSDPKVYIVFLHGAESNASYALKNVTTEMFMGINCMKGIYAGHAGWLSDRPVYIPLEKVTVVTEFDSFESYVASLKRFEGDRKPRPKPRAKRR